MLQTNCLHEIFFDAAIRDARALDEYFAKHGVPKGPLHGLPVSLKDQFHVKGVETTMVCWNELLRFFEDLELTQ